MLYCIFNEYPFNGRGANIGVEKSFVEQMVKSYLRGSEVTISGIKYEAGSEVFQIYELPSEFANSSSIDQFIQNRYSGNISNRIFSENFRNVTDEFLVGRAYGELKNDYFNIYINDGIKKPIITVLSKKEVETFLAEFSEGRKDIWISGRTIKLDNPKSIKIFDIDFKWLSNKRGEIKNQINKMATLNGKWSTEVLRHFGKEVTSDFEIKPFGSLDKSKNMDIDMINKESSSGVFSDENDLNYYFNSKNIPNQELVFETYNFFEKGIGNKYFNVLEFLNLLNWHYRFLSENVDRPFDIVVHFKNLPLSQLKKHILIGFILKWYGGYPVNNLNSQFNTTLKFIEAEYLMIIKENQEKQRSLVNNVLSASESNKESNRQMSDDSNLVTNLDKQVNNAERTRQLKQIEMQVNSALNLRNNENVTQEDKSLMLFISHSSKDKEIVDLFVDKILQLALKINLDNIFYTSIQTTSITSGEDFRSAIKKNLMEASHVIQIITPNYKTSEVCLNEMGAAWVLNNKVKAFIVQPIDFGTVGFIHQPNQLLKLTDTKDLMKFIDEMKDSKHSVAVAEVQRQVDSFVKEVVSILEKQIKPYDKDNNLVELLTVFNGEWQLLYTDINGVENKEHVKISEKGVYIGDGESLYYIQFVQLKNGKAVLHKIKIKDDLTHSIENLELKSKIQIIGTDSNGHKLIYNKKD